MLERDPYSEVCTMAKQVLDTIYNKIVLVQRDRKGSEVFRSLSQAEGKSVSAPGSPAKPSFLLGEPPRSHNTTLPASLSKSVTGCQHSLTLASRHAHLGMDGQQQFRNSHEGGLPLAGSDNGCMRVWGG